MPKRRTFQMLKFRKSSKTTVIFLLGIIYLLCVFALFQNCSPDKKEDRLYSSEMYVGDRACQNCHQQEFDDWEGSHHDLAMQEASDKSILGNFNDVTFASNGVTSRFYRSGDKYMVNTEGADGQNEDFEVEYTFGVEPLQQYMARFPGGRLQCLLVAWDSKKNVWFDLMPQRKLNTDDWLHWTKGSMTWNTMCADCHSTNLKKNFDPVTKTYETEWSLINVSCEACHGSGKQHIEYISLKRHLDPDKVAGSYLHQIPGTNKKKQIDDCARCHSRRGPITNNYVHSEKYMDQFVPSMINPGLYYVDGQILDEVYVYGSFLQSKMYNRDVGCMDCHNPHSLELRFEGNDLCTQCHVKEKYDDFSHHFHTQNSESSLCINCHMVGKTYMRNDFRRDHSFRVPRPDLSVVYGTPNACTQCHTDQSDEWAAKVIQNHYGSTRPKHFSPILMAIHSGDFNALPDLLSMISDTSYPHIIRATATNFLGGLGVIEANAKILNALRNDEPMIRYAAVSAMASFSTDDRLRYLVPLLNDSIRAVRTNVAYMLADISPKLFRGSPEESYKNAVEEFETSLDVQADFPAGQLMRGQYNQKKGDNESARQAYLEAIVLDPYLPQPHFNLGVLLYGESNFDSAVEYFRKAIDIDTSYVDAYYSLGLLLAEMNNLPEAEKSLGMSARLSGNPRYYYNWGLTLQNLNQPKEAEKAYLSALEIQPNSESNLYALTILYVQQKRKIKARNTLIQLIQVNPQNTEYQNMLKTLR